jgi:hypothetical protein
MPTTIREVFEAGGLCHEGVIRWGEELLVSSSGVYVVSLTKSLDTYDGKLDCAPLAEAEFERWRGVCPKLSLDGVKATVPDLMKRIGRFWIPDETILYIGKAASLSKRLKDYYKTPIGAPRPHSGGYFLKLLSNVGQLWVHYGLCPKSDPECVESRMLYRFCKNVSDVSRQALHDPNHPFPFGNIEWHQKQHKLRKAHALRGTRR